MKVILTNKKEKSNIKQITELLNLILFDYNVEVVEKKKNETQNKRITIKKTNKTVIERHKKVIIKDTEKMKREKEWLEDYYYSQSKDKEEIDKLVNYYSSNKRIANDY